EIIKKSPISFTSLQLDISIKELTGLVNQVPSMYSAIKHNGIPLYKYARDGLEVARTVRQVYIYKIDSLKHKKDYISFTVVCSKGTYIRTLVEDLGEKLGCGAHVVFLRRLQIASYNDSKLVQMSDLHDYQNKNNFHQNAFFQYLDNFLMPIDSPISFLPKVYISFEEAHRLK
ncbi:tRNA pseudouridine(55) synthase TruB, partial [Buchnera aphidicola]|nr:tRNA pseudouridine(55) synthase TruB [Buchnera aphidicola]